MNKLNESRNKFTLYSVVTYFNLRFYLLMYLFIHTLHEWCIAYVIIDSVFDGSRPINYNDYYLKLFKCLCFAGNSRVLWN